ncbi:MAG: hypothetical protein IKP88_16725 [Lachnospiraceae bacterium]|nr:hypothetical protein [Lachnospiraceae bacterium]
MKKFILLLVVSILLVVLSCCSKNESYEVENTSKNDPGIKKEIDENGIGLSGTTSIFVSDLSKGNRINITDIETINKIINELMNNKFEYEKQDNDSDENSNTYIAVFYCGDTEINDCMYYSDHHILINSKDMFFESKLLSYELIDNKIKGKVSDVIIPDIPSKFNYAGFNLINYPRDVTINRYPIDTVGLIYEENPSGFTENKNYGVLKIYVTEYFIKRYIDECPVHSENEFKFKVNNNIITVSENSLKVENELFGLISEREIISFCYNNTFFMEATALSEIIGMFSMSHYREKPNDKYMKTENLNFESDYMGLPYTDSMYRYGYDYYTQGFVREKPKGEIIGVNLRGNYIYKDNEGNYFIDANGLYYMIFMERSKIEPDITLD